MKNMKVQYKIFLKKRSWISLKKKDEEYHFLQLRQRTITTYCIHLPHQISNFIRYVILFIIILYFNLVLKHFFNCMDNVCKTQTFFELISIYILSTVNKNSKLYVIFSVIIINVKNYNNIYSQAIDCPFFVHTLGFIFSN